MARMVSGVSLFLSLGVVAWSAAQDTSSGSALQQIQNLTRSAAKSYGEKDFAKSSADIEQAQQLLSQLAADLKKEYSRIEKAHQLLVQNGQKLPELTSLADLFSIEMSEASAESAPQATPMASESESSEVRETSSDSQVSFSNEVVPVLSKHCGNCHIRQARGQFNASSYAALIKGTRKGPVVVAGDPKKSSLVTLIENRKMPPRSSGIPEPELKILRDWVAQGASFDGDDENAKISVTGGPAGGGRGNGPRNDD